VIQRNKEPVRDRENPISNQFKIVSFLLSLDLMLVAAFRISLEVTVMVLIAHPLGPGGFNTTQGIHTCMQRTVQ
jgi:hypothetical protein